jgi:hypothetical protein
MGSHGQGQIIKLDALTQMFGNGVALRQANAPLYTVIAWYFGPQYKTRTTRGSDRQARINQQSTAPRQIPSILIISHVGAFRQKLMK